jgi:hypothetical protein
MEGGVSVDGARLQVGEDGEKDGASDRLNGLSVLLAVVAFDAADETLHNG